MSALTYALSRTRKFDRNLCRQVSQEAQNRQYRAMSSTHSGIVNRRKMLVWIIYLMFAVHNNEEWIQYHHRNSHRNFDNSDN